MALSHLCFLTTRTNTSKAVHHKTRKGVRALLSRRLLKYLLLVGLVGSLLFASIVRADINNTRVDPWGTLELSGSNWLSGQGVDVYSNGPTASGPSPDTYNYVNNINNVPTQSGIEWQCVELVNRLYLTRGWITSTWVGNGNQLFANAPANLTKEANGSITYLQPGDVITLDDKDLGHAGIVNSVSGSAVQIVNQNTKAVYSSATWANGTIKMSGWNKYTVQGVIHAPGGSQNAVGNVVFTNGGGQTFANSKPYSPDSPWTQLSNSTNTISASGNYMAWIDGCGAAWATDNFAQNPATRITSCGGATQIAIGSKGNLAFADACGMVHATDTYNIASSWVVLTGCNGARAIAAGGGGTGEVAVINGCSALNITTDFTHWTQIAGCNGAQRVSIGPTGAVAFSNGCGASYATQDYRNAGSWVKITGCSGTTQLAAGSNKALAFADGCGRVHGTMTYDQPGSWVILTGCSGARAIAIGTNGRTGVINGCGSLNVTDNFQSWTRIAPCSDALKVAIG